MKRLLMVFQYLIIGAALAASVAYSRSPRVPSSKGCTGWCKTTNDCPGRSGDSCVCESGPTGGCVIVVGSKRPQ